MQKAFEERWPRSYRGSGSFAYRCTTHNNIHCPHQAETFARLWREAKSMEEFLDSARTEPSLTLTSQAYAEIGRLEGWNVPCTETIEKHEVRAESGSVAIGDLAGTCEFLIPNGYGDGRLTVYVATGEGQINRDFFDHRGFVQGKIRLYASDCEPATEAGEDAIVLAGRFLVSSYDGDVLFQGLKELD